MLNPFAPGVGGVLSADIAVPEHEREQEFYSRILTTGNTALWREDLMNNRGMPVIGLGARTPEYEALPLQWMPHFQVADVGAGVERALALGADEIMHGKDEAGQSQWAVLTDPAGAAFGLIPVVGAEAEALDLSANVGRISSLMLVAPDVSRMGAFYEQVIGWSVEKSGLGDGVRMRRPDGGYAAEIRPAGETNAGIPTAWILGLPVADLTESLRLVREGGGDIIRGSSEAGHAIIKDPVGVYLALQTNQGGQAYGKLPPIG